MSGKFATPKYRVIFATSLLSMDTAVILCNIYMCTQEGETITINYCNKITIPRHDSSEVYKSYAVNGFLEQLALGGYDY